MRRRQRKVFDKTQVRQMMTAFVYHWRVSVGNKQGMPAHHAVIETADEFNIDAPKWILDELVERYGNRK